MIFLVFFSFFDWLTTKASDSIFVARNMYLDMSKRLLAYSELHEVKINNFDLNYLWFLIIHAMFALHCSPTYNISLVFFYLLGSTICKES
jgi:hypothetical protein